ncbi:excalibur calcium-binding domain-containing protein [Paenibacillus sp.]|uniref:excalibur calcium-binding domain-containing protein n=1 Tax=Paenibacillus sp. TaxID=58172 RepID=UPI00281279D6|nr:excalibur calcium-binding domain-containing protein [Paenibacillus sp.]
MIRHLRWLFAVAVTLLFAGGCSSTAATPATMPTPAADAADPGFDVELVFPSDAYPETALHIYDAIELGGASDVCTIDRDGADDNRRRSLAGIEPQAGYDRDEWPMAMCAEGGEGANVAYIDSSDNRGAGAWVGHRLEAYPDGTRVRFVVSKPALTFGEYTAEQEALRSKEAESSSPAVSYANCAAVSAAGKAPLFKGEPGYSAKLDRDRDGIACET